MAKTNPFLKGMTESEVAKLRRKAPYVDQVYNPETNEVNYDLILRRLNDTTKKVSDVEQVFLNQVKRNLQREYWRQAVQDEHVTNGAYKDQYEGSRKSLFGYRVSVYGVSGNRVQKQFDYLQSRLKDGKISDFRSGFDNYPASRSFIWGDYYRLIKPFQFMPEDYQRYKNTDAVSEPYYNELYSARNNDEVQVDYNPPNDAVDKGRKRGSYTFPGGRAQDLALDINAPKKNMTALEKIFNAITSGVENVNRVYAENKERKEQERQNAINRAIKAEAAVASYQRKEKFDREQFERALAAKDKAYNEETAKRTAEFENWRKTFEASSIEQAKQQAEQHTREMSQLRAESVRQAQDLANAKVENERIKSQNAILLKNNTRRRIALKQIGNIGLNFVGAGQRDSQGTALLSVLAGKNRYVPVARRFNEYGRFVESRGDTAVPDTFLSLISPQPQNRSKK